MLYVPFDLRRRRKFKSITTEHGLPRINSDMPEPSDDNSPASYLTRCSSNLRKHRVFYCILTYCCRHLSIYKALFFDKVQILLLAYSVIKKIAVCAFITRYHFIRAPFEVSCPSLNAVGIFIFNYKAPYEAGIEPA